MKITSEWIKDAQLQKVFSLLNSDGEVGYLVGGCVRNALMGKSITDIDIATSADPHAVSDQAIRAGFKVIPTGLEHGTVTVLTDAGPLEITTFRQDLTTDGRHAEVAFTKDIDQDAARRDFTMNALYCDADGNVVDPLGGIKDLEAGHVRFIGDPIARIEEDYLRILRFFRFTAVYGNPELGIDAEGLAACAQCLDGLSLVSKERVGSEMLKLLAAPDPSVAISAMSHANILQQILPGSDPKYLPVLVHLETDHQIDPMRRLAILGGVSAKDNLRLSKKQAHRLTILQTAQDPSGKRTAYKYGYDVGLGAVLVSASYSEMTLSPDLEIQLEGAAQAVFPITASDIFDHVKGPALGSALADLESEWITSDFTATRDILMQHFHAQQKAQNDGN